LHEGTIFDFFITSEPRRGKEREAKELSRRAAEGAEGKRRGREDMVYTQIGENNLMNE
jgi:hypothetical protein